MSGIAPRERVGGAEGAVKIYGDVAFGRWANASGHEEVERERRGQISMFCIMICTKRHSATLNIVVFRANIQDAALVYLCTYLSVKYVFGQILSLWIHFSSISIVRKSLDKAVWVLNYLSLP